MRPEWYEIRVEGHLPSGWSNRFEGLDIQRYPCGESILSGPLADQSALHGVLAKIRNLNLKLVSVNRCSQEQAAGRRSSPER
jgi:hypothetical protein